jgi:hypothetical protein
VIVVAGRAGIPESLLIERDRVVIQLGPAAREPARSGVELQQQREPQPGRPALPATSSRSSSRKVQWSTSSSRSIGTTTASADPRLTIARGTDKRVPGMAGGGTSGNSGYGCR